ncbi:Calcium-dependent lipid-binding (CaLB domain) family protein [Striga hermonthica]|uniref:Calcium-dependent lipid-binding (CaLB domain) family protein n=1 Tax=Striga hermonthica TaxID=68872 RepID=A0A9N7R856_STRHE|nr:Calcium-dependent lipid-binding (CaLB domain) family protein [Striga hermonthica]
MDVHTVVSISGGGKYSMQKTKMPSDTAGGNNPTWGFPMKFTVEEASLQQSRLLLDFKLVCRRALGDKTTGRVSVPVKELFDGWEGGRKFVSYQVRNPNGKLKGQLTFSYQFIGNGFIGADLLSMYPLVGVEPTRVYSKVAKTCGVYCLPFGGGSSAGGLMPPAGIQSAFSLPNIDGWS